MYEPFCRGLVFFGVIGMSYAQSFKGHRLVVALEWQNKQELSGALVELHELKQTRMVNTEGRAAFENLRNGRYHLHISLLGFHAQQIQILVMQDTLVVVKMERAAHELHEVNVESELLKQDERESSVLVDKVNKKFLLEHAAPTLMQTLEALPGVRAASMGVGVSKPVIRGLSLNRVHVYDQGVRQEGQQWGGDHGLELDAYSIDNVEVIKGPSTLMYGSDAFGGVISTHRSLLMPTHTRKASAQLISRTNNMTWGIHTDASTKGRSISTGGKFTLLSYSDYRVPADKYEYNGYILPIEQQKLLNTAGRELHGSGHVGIQRSWGYSFLTLSNFNQRIGLFPGALGRPLESPTAQDGDFRNITLPYQDINHFKCIFNSNVKMGNAWLESDIGWQYNQRREHSEPHVHGYGPTPSGTLGLGLNLHTFSLNSRLHWVPHAPWQCVSGVQLLLQQNKAFGYEYLIPSFVQRQAALYNVAKYTLSSRVVWNIGVRVDVVRIQAQEVRMYLYPSNGIPVDRLRSSAYYGIFGFASASQGVSIKGSEQWTFKANISHNYRNPSPQELLADGVHHGTFRHEQGDSSLVPERGLQSDVAMVWEGKRGYVSLTPYFNYFDKYIYLSPTGEYSDLPGAGQIYRFVQQDALHAGMECASKWIFTKHIKLGSQVDYVWAQNLETGLPLPFIPPLGMRVEPEATLPFASGVLQNTYIRTTLYYSASQLRVARNERTTPEYLLTHIALGSHIGHASRPWECYLQINNVFDVLYFHHLSRYRILNLPEPGRNFSANLKKSF